MARTGPGIALLVIFACLLPAPALAQADGSGPSWYKKKKKEKEEQKEEKQAKDAEKPIVDGDQDLQASSLSAPKKFVPETNLLFKQKGMTDSFALDYVKVNQQTVAGPSLAAHFAMGWWWQPDLILSGYARVMGTNWETNTILWMTVGPQLRFLPSKRWAFTAFAGFTYSQGLTREKTAHLPVVQEATRARHGLTAGWQATYFFWPKRDLGIGPTVGAWIGKQDERTPTMLTFGVTLQAGRPNYTGDLTAW